MPTQARRANTPIKWGLATIGAGAVLMMGALGITMQSGQASAGTMVSNMPANAPTATLGQTVTATPAPQTAQIPSAAPAVKAQPAPTGEPG